MIKLERTQSWYRPYTVIASGTEYVIDECEEFLSIFSEEE